MPSGLLSILPGGPEVALRLVSRPAVRAVSLTGGVAAGEAVRAAAGIKPVYLELGANSPNIVCADADLERAAKEIAGAAFGASGQQCISAQRVIVERPVVDTFVELFAAASAALVVGDPTDAATDIGPLVNDRAAERVRRHLDDAEARGGKLVLDGRAEDLCFGPSIVRDVPADALILQEEVFGPVAAVVPVDSVDEAIASPTPAISASRPPASPPTWRRPCASPRSCRRDRSGSTSRRASVSTRIPSGATARAGSGAKVCVMRWKHSRR